MSKEALREKYSSAIEYHKAKISVLEQKLYDLEHPKKSKVQEKQEYIQSLLESGVVDEAGAKLLGLKL